MSVEVRVREGFKSGRMLPPLKKRGESLERSRYSVPSFVSCQFSTVKVIPQVLWKISSHCGLVLRESRSNHDLFSHKELLVNGVGVRVIRVEEPERLHYWFS